MRFLYFIFLFIFYGSLANSLSASDQKLRDQLIDDLRLHYQSLSNKDPSKNAIKLRLAHILSLRAEDQIAKKWSEGCEPCFKKGVKDGKESLTLYKSLNSILQTKQPYVYVKALFQQSHIYYVMGKNQRAINLLRRVLEEKTIDSDTMNRAQFRLGEMNFQSYDYEKALMYFNKIEKVTNFGWGFKNRERKLRSLFGLYRYDEAVDYLNKFAKSPEYTKNLSDEDKNLRAKIEEDIINFYSKASVSDKHLNSLYQFSKSNKKDNEEKVKNKRFFELAVSLSRIGRFSDSNRVWNKYLEKESDWLTQMEVHMYIIENNFLKGETDFLKLSKGNLQKILEAKKQIKKCVSPICSVVHERVKKYLLEAFTAYAKSSTQNSLHELFSLYNQAYTGEYDMLFKEAKLAQSLKQYTLAQSLFQKSVIALKDFMSQNVINAEVKKGYTKDIEAETLLQLEMAELSGSDVNKKEGYQFYLDHGSDRKRLFQSRYQKAYLDYQDKKYQETVDVFKKLALEDGWKKDKEISDLQLSSARLTLSALSKLSDDVSIEKLAEVFSEKFTEYKSEFIRFKHVALFNLIEVFVKDRNLSSYPISPSKDKNIRKAWKLLSQFDLSEATEEEKNQFYMNRLILAKELLYLDEVNHSIDYLLTDNLDKKTRLFVLGWKRWVAETQFDFKEVLRLTQILEPKYNEDSQIIYLANLTELAGGDFFSLYEKFITKNPKSDEARAMILRMIESAKPVKKKELLVKYKDILASDPVELNYLVLLADEGKLDKEFLQTFLQLESMKTSYLAKFFKRKNFIDQFNQDYESMLKRYPISSTKSRKVLSRNIRYYAKLIDFLESEVVKSVEFKDQIAQLTTTTALYRKTMDFYNYVINSERPQGLNLEEAKEYNDLLMAQIQPYKDKADKVLVELDQFWGNKKRFQVYEKEFKNNPVLYAPLRWEVMTLRELATKDTQTSLSQLLEKAESFVQKEKQLLVQVEVEKKEPVNSDLIDRVKKSPFNRKALKKLVTSELKHNNPAMVYYVKSRIQKIKSIKNQRLSL